MATHSTSLLPPRSISSHGLSQKEWRAIVNRVNIDQVRQRRFEPDSALLCSVVSLAFVGKDIVDALQRVSRKCHGACHCGANSCERRECLDGRRGRRRAG
eukprot:5580014-Prymnesium_polylepis.1